MPFFCKQNIQEFRRFLFTDFRQLLKIRIILVQAALQSAQPPNILPGNFAVMLFPQVRLNQTSKLIDKYDLNPRGRWSDETSHCSKVAAAAEQLLALTEESA